MGGEGDDVYYFTRTSGHDTVDNFDTDNSVDAISFSEDSSITNMNLWFEKVVDAENRHNLKVTVLGSNASVTILEWFDPNTGESQKDFKVDMFNATDQVSLEIDQLLTIMENYGDGSAPAESEIPVSLQPAVEDIWDDNPPPVITLDSVVGAESEHYLQMDGSTNVMMANAIGTSMTSFTAVLDFIFDESADIERSALSYAVSASQNNELFINSREDFMRLAINGIAVDVPYDIRDGERHHLTINWDSATGLVTVYDFDQEVYSEVHNNVIGHSIQAGGTLSLGQEQDALGGEFDLSQSFQGQYYSATLYDTVLTPTEVASGTGNANRMFDFAFDEGTGASVQEAVSGQNVTILGGFTWGGSSGSGDVTIAPDGSITMLEDGTVEVLFTVTDESAPGISENSATLNVSAVASDTTLFSSIQTQYVTGDTWKVILTPAADQFGGPTDITVTVIDEGSLSASSQLTVTVDPVSDAPVISETEKAMSAILEDTETNEGQTIAELFSVGDITDADGTVVEAIAVYATDSVNGSWEFQLNGSGPWTDVGSVSVSNARLLGPTDKIRFVPDADFDEQATFNFRAWDQTSGTTGNTADVSSNGGTTAFSSNTGTVTQTVTAVNDAPTFVNLTNVPDFDEGGSQTHTLTLSDIDDPYSELTVAASTDIPGVTASVSGDGPTRTLTVDTAGNNFNGTATITLTVTDNDKSTTEDIYVIVDPVNDAPVILIDAQTLAPIQEDPQNIPGQTVADMITNGAFTDDDGAAIEAIAVYATNTTNGSWQYQLNGSGSWINVGAVSNSNALLLGPSDKVRFIPNAHFNGDATFNFRAWDQTSGGTGTKVNVNTNGGTTAFSSNTGTVTQTVTAVNDAPVISTADHSLAPIQEDQQNISGMTIADVITNGSFTDEDGNVVEAIAVYATETANGSWQYQLNGSGSWITVGSVSNSNALLLGPSDKVRFIPSDDFNGEATFNFRAWDQTSGIAGNTANVSTNGGTTAFSSGTGTVTQTVTAVNDAPTSADPSEDIAALEDDMYIFAPGDFPFADTPDGDVLDSVRIVTGPSKGTLTLNGVAVTNGQIISVEDITSEKLKYLALPFENGDNYTSFTFRVRDVHGAESATHTITIDVTAVNTKPELIGFDYDGDDIDDVTLIDDGNYVSPLGVKENAPGNPAQNLKTKIGHVLYDDIDSPLNGLNFSIIGATDSGGNAISTAIFSIDPTDTDGDGEVDVFVRDSSLLDYESLPLDGTDRYIDLHISVNDGEKSDSGWRRVLIRDVDETAPTTPVISDLEIFDNDLSEYVSSGTHTNKTTHKLTGTVTDMGDINGDPSVANFVDIYESGNKIGEAQVINDSWEFTASGRTAERSHNYTVIARDHAGNESNASASRSVIVDTTAPTATSVDLLAGSDTGALSTDNITNISTPQIRTSLSNSAKVGDTLQIKDSGTVRETHVLTSGNISAGYVDLTVNIGVGDSTVTAHLFDAAGNESTSNPSLAITVDQTGPVVDVDTIPHDENNPIVITPLTATDDHAVTWSSTFGGDDGDKFELVNGNQLEFKSAYVPDYEAPGSADGDNNYEVTVTAIDSAGNETPHDITVNVNDEVSVVAIASLVPSTLGQANLIGNGITNNGLAVGFELYFVFNLGFNGGNSVISTTIWDPQNNIAYQHVILNGNTTITIGDDYYIDSSDNLATSYELTPIILDLDGDGVEMANWDISSINFDVDNDGALERTGWVGADDGLLVLDRNKDGVIDRGSEISFVQDLPGARTDMEGLRAFDSNNDGLFDASDARFGEFQVWQDANQDGISQADELSSLADQGIAAIDLALTSSGQTAENTPGNIIYNTANFIDEEGELGAIGDVGFRYVEDYVDGPQSSSAATSAKSDHMAGEATLRTTDQATSQLIQAMAAFGAPASAEIDLKDPTSQPLATTLAANWDSRS